MNPYLKLARRWEEIANKLEQKPVVMTAAVHRLFANELKAIIALNSEAGLSIGDDFLIHGNKESVALVRKLMEKHHG